MALRTAFECTTDFPDDMVDDGEEIVIPGGRAVSEAVVDLLREAGLETTDPQIEDEYGWEFYASRGRRRYWMIVTDLDDIKIVQASDLSPFLVRLREGKAPYRKFVDELEVMLKGHARFLTVDRLPTI